MSATEELRAMLDARGVEWWPMYDVETGYREDGDTEFLVYGCWHVAHEWGCRLQVDMLTPEQAIEATLGRGTCRITDNGPWGYPYVCSECGASFDPDVNGGELNYCPNCGGKVVGA